MTSRKKYGKCFTSPELTTIQTNTTYKKIQENKKTMCSILISSEFIHISAASVKLVTRCCDMLKKLAFLSRKAKFMTVIKNAEETQTS